MTDSKEKDIVYSESVKAGKRIYYLDVKQSRNGDRYISITESKKVVDEKHPFNSTDTPHYSFEKHKIFLYKEDFEKFVEALTNVIGYVKASQSSFSQQDDSQKQHLLSDADLHLDIDF